MQNGSPTVVQRYDDVAAYRDDNGEYIYGWAGTDSNDSKDSQYAYQITLRVPTVISLNSPLVFFF
jgi:hypothetical protein